MLQTSPREQIHSAFVKSFAFEESTNPLPCSQRPDTQTCPGPRTFLLRTATDLTTTYSEEQIRPSEVMVAEQVNNSQFPPTPPQITEPKDLWLC